MKYLPVKMSLDPSESMNNMGTLRVDILDAADLPSADRNGFSDPFCKFKLNDQNVYETKVQKKTLHPAWNEFFEVPIPSRTAAKFTIKVMDWDLTSDADFLGDADINLEHLEPMKAQVVNLTLNGKKGSGTAGVVRLRLLFKAAYVTRSRQGSSTFSGTIGPAGKVLGAPVKGVGKVGGAVGGGVLKGATFIRHGFRSPKDGRASTSDANGVNGIVDSPNGDLPIPSIETPKQDAGETYDAQAPSTPQSHYRSSSFGSKSFTGAGGKAESGSAEFSVLSASGFPSDTKIQVIVRQVVGKTHKDVLKTKPVKSASGEASWENKSTRYPCSADAQFQIAVRDHRSLFGGGDELGEALFFVDDSTTGSEKMVKVGSGNVVLRSSFTMADRASIKDSPRAGSRRSFLSKREKDLSRQSTPS